MNVAEIARTVHGRKMLSGWIARRPADEDHNPSLSLKDGEDRRILLHCHCGYDQIAGSMRLRYQDPLGVQRGVPCPLLSGRSSSRGRLPLPGL